MALNVSGVFGGPPEIFLFTRAWSQVYGGLDVSPFEGHDPFVARAALYRRVCAELGYPQAVAIVGSKHIRPDALTARYFEIQAQQLRAAGFQSRFFEPGDLLDGLTAEPAYRLLHKAFTVEDWRGLGIDLRPIRQAVECGHILFPPQSSYLLANKKAMAWLSEGQAWMTDADRVLVRRYLPWTRIVEHRKVDWWGQIHDFPRLLMQHQQSLVLKKAIGMMGLQVTLGPHCSRDKWEAEVARALSLFHPPISRI